MIKSIILDIGDVLAKSNYHEFLHKRDMMKKQYSVLKKQPFSAPYGKSLTGEFGIFHRYRTGL